MNGVSIEIFPSHDHLSDGLRTALRGPAAARRPRVTYSGVLFRLVYSDQQLTNLKAVLDDLDAELPEVFRSGELTVSMVVVRSSIPSPLVPRPGWYIGDNFGFPGAACCIDPAGHEDGRPQIFANGSNFANVVALYQRVMIGNLMPGYKNDAWSSKVYQR